jgi:tetratricopeptide (TPR) repeat protein
MISDLVTAAPAALEITAKPPAATAPDWRRIAQVSLLILATIVCYLPSLRGGFLWDDREIIVNDPLLKSAAGLGRIWFGAATPDYYPIDYTGLWLEWHCWGADPLGYRLVNLALHITSACLFWRLLKTWRVRGAWCAALLFALHPLNVASVAWIVELKNVLSMAFYLAALLCWAGSEQADAHPARQRTLYFAALAAFALALGSKASVVMLPGVLLLVAWWRHGVIRREDMRRTLPFFGLALLAGLVSVWFQHQTMLARDLALPPSARAALLGKSICFYLGKAAWPHPLVMIYPRWQLLPARAVDFLPLCLLLLFCAGVAWLGLRRGWRGPAAALAFFCLNLLPVAGVFHLSFYALSYVSDHLAQVSLLSFCALVAATLAAAWQRPQLRLSASAATVFILGAGALLTHQRAKDFGSGKRLWRQTLALNPASAAAQDNYGLALAETGHAPAAETHYREALRLDPTSVPTWTDFAALLRQEQRWPEASAAYRRLLAIHAEPDDFNNYGVVLLYLGDAAQAGAQFRQALALDPALFSAHSNLYKLARATGDRAAMAVELRICRRLDPRRAGLSGLSSSD